MNKHAGDINNHADSAVFTVLPGGCFLSADAVIGSQGELAQHTLICPALVAGALLMIQVTSGRNYVAGLVLFAVSRDRPHHIWSAGGLCRPKRNVFHMNLQVN